MQQLLLSLHTSTSCKPQLCRIKSDEINVALGLLSKNTSPDSSPNAETCLTSWWCNLLPYLTKMRLQISRLSSSERLLPTLLTFTFRIMSHTIMLCFSERSWRFCTCGLVGPRFRLYVLHAAALDAAWSGRSGDIENTVSVLVVREIRRPRESFCSIPVGSWLLSVLLPSACHLIILHVSFPLSFCLHYGPRVALLLCHGTDVGVMVVAAVVCNLGNCSLTFPGFNPFFITWYQTYTSRIFMFSLPNCYPNFLCVYVCVVTLLIYTYCRHIKPPILQLSNFQLIYSCSAAWKTTYEPKTTDFKLGYSDWFQICQFDNN